MRLVSLSVGWLVVSCVLRDPEQREREREVEANERQLLCSF